MKFLISNLTELNVFIVIDKQKKIAKDTSKMKKKSALCRILIEIF